MKKLLSTANKLFLVGALSIGLTSSVRAATASYNTATASTGWQSLGFDPITLYCAQFDSSLGLLLSVTLHMTAYERAGLSIENGATSSANIRVSLAGVVEATDGTLDAMANLAKNFGPYSLAASGDPQGPPIAYDQSGSDFADLGTLSNTKTSTANITTGLAPYIGLGTVAVDVSGSGGWSASGSTAYSLNITAFQGEGEVYLTYDYIPVVPEPSTGLLLGLGFGGLILVWRRRFTC
jgi:hypothetical protein